MSANLPEVLDAWRIVAARRGVEGRMPLASLTRLRDSLADTEGDVVYAVDFDHDSLKVPYAELRIEADLPLICQRSLQRFGLPVRIVQRLGLIRDEAEEAALPPGYEPLLMPDDGMLQFLSPLGWEHINLTGDYVWRQNGKFADSKFRPLRAPKEVT